MKQTYIWGILNFQLNGKDAINMFTNIIIQRNSIIYVEESGIKVSDSFYSLFLNGGLEDFHGNRYIDICIWGAYLLCYLKVV